MWPKIKGLLALSGDAEEVQSWLQPSEEGKMFETLQRWFACPSVARMAEQGRVFCPVQQQDVDVEACMACTHLLTFRLADDGRVAEIVCSPSYRALTATGMR